MENGVVVSIVHNDITREQVYAIVNAANSQLLHGGGVAGAISRKGGRVIDQESREHVRKNGPVPTGGCASTNAGSLPCKKVLHTVGPIYS